LDAREQVTLDRCDVGRRTDDALELFAFLVGPLSLSLALLDPVDEAGQLPAGSDRRGQPIDLIRETALALPKRRDAGLNALDDGPNFYRAQRLRIYIQSAVRARLSEYDAALARAHIKTRGTAMSSRKLDELASDVDDAATIVHELQDDHEQERDEKLDELDKTLEHASDTIDDLENKDDE
jgi:outer membrane murein-binding lipoprotein Lpp